MFSIPGSTPCGRTRREFLWETGMGFTGTALTAMLAGRPTPEAGDALGVLRILLRVDQLDERVRPVIFARNFGHQIAVTAGMDYARGDAVVIIDSDLQDPPEVIPDLIQKWREESQPKSEEKKAPSPVKP